MMEDVADVLGEFRQKAKEGKRWIAYENNRSPLTADDFYYFHSKQDDRFLGRTLAQLPLPVVMRQIEMEVVNARLNNQQADHIIIIPAHILDLSKTHNLDYPALQLQLEERMKDIEWEHVFYDPLEANTEAELAEDLTAFNVLEQLVYDLQTVYQSGAGGRELVDTVTDKYWTGHPMEDQKAELFNNYAQNEDIQLLVKENDHPVSYEALDAVQLALINGENWMAYNNMVYFIDVSNIYFFNTLNEANEFAANNKSDQDNFNVIHIASVEDVLKQIPYRQEPREDLKSGIDPDQNPLYNYEEDAFTKALIEHFEQQSFNHSKTNVMNTDNFDYLQSQMKYAGFGEGLTTLLEKNLKEGLPDFQLQAAHEFGKDKMEAVLYFKKSEQEGKDMYFFNKYDATLQNDAGNLSHTFFINNKGQSITFKEACNLLNNRSVFKEVSPKEGEKYKAWIKLDQATRDENGNAKFKYYNENYGFDLKEAVGRIPLKELSDPDKMESLYASLQKGNAALATLVKGDKEVKVQVAADPQFKSLKLYDMEGKKLFMPGPKHAQQYGMAPADQKKLESDNTLQTGQPLEQTGGQAITKGAKLEMDSDPVVMNKKRDLLPKKVNDNPLLPKKKTRKSKGKGIA